MPARPKHVPGTAVAMALALAGAAWAEPGTVLKATELRTGPLGSAEVVAKLAAKDAVDINERRGAWAAVTTAGGQAGWVRVLNLRTASGEAGPGGAAALAEAFRTGSSGTAVSTGVKGLSAEELRNASPDTAEAARLAGFAATPDDALTFASQHQLASQDVDYLPKARQPRRRNR